MIQHYPQSGGGSKEDKWHSRPLRRADDRAIADDLPTEHPIPAKKNTRRWCKGKVGREHQTEWRWRYYLGSPAVSRKGCYRLICSVCGKVLDYRFTKSGEQD
jgi:hypothetical protein